jgi:4-hydroxy-2-oxoheptanedioate aldolase
MPSRRRDTPRWTDDARARRWAQRAVQRSIDRRGGHVTAPQDAPEHTDGDPSGDDSSDDDSAEDAAMTDLEHPHDLAGAPASAGRPGAIPLRHRVGAGPSLLGTFSVMPSTDVIELIALAGFDFVILDMEHGPYTLDLVHSCLLAAAARGLPVVVRVAEHNPALIGAVLDVGADGVLVPQIRSAQDARDVVAAARFAPQGSRGSNPWVRAARYQGDPAWLAASNDSTLVMVMVEGAEAVNGIDEILAVDGLDAVFLGPVDLSHALGVPGQPEHPRVLSTLADVARRAAAAKVGVAVFAPDARRARYWRERGLNLVACGVDSYLVLDALRAKVRSISPAG